MLKIPTVKERLSKLILAGVLGVLMCMPVGMAFAADNQPSAGAQSGTGETTMKMIAKSKDTMSGTVDSKNPDADDDGLGDNIAFTVPSAINYVVSADGTMTGPTNVSMKNESVFPIHVDGMSKTVLNGFNLVEDATVSDAFNAFDMTIGPEDNAVNLYQSYSQFDKTAWNMGFNQDGVTGIDENGFSDSIDAALVKYLIDEPQVEEQIEMMSINAGGDGKFYIRANVSEPWVELVSVEAVNENTGNFTDVNGRIVTLSYEIDAETGNFWVVDSGLIGIKITAPDTLPLQTSGHAANIGKDISQLTEFAKIKWYVKAGVAS